MFDGTKIFIFKNSKWQQKLISKKSIAPEIAGIYNSNSTTLFWATYFVPRFFGIKLFLEQNKMYTF